MVTGSAGLDVGSTPARRHLDVTSTSLDAARRLDAQGSIQREGGAAAPAAPAGGADGAVGESPEMVALACVCSSPIVVDARKRTKGERPLADANDVRLVSKRPRGPARGDGGAPPPPPPGSAGRMMFQ